MLYKCFVFPGNSRASAASASSAAARVTQLRMRADRLIWSCGGRSMVQRSQKQQQRQPGWEAGISCDLRDPGQPERAWWHRGLLPVSVYGAPTRGQTYNIIPHQEGTSVDSWHTLLALHSLSHSLGTLLAGAWWSSGLSYHLLCLSWPDQAGPTCERRLSPTHMQTQILKSVRSRIISPASNTQLIPIFIYL